MKQVAWVRQVSRPRIDDLYGDAKPCFGMGDLGLEQVLESPAYDNGMYFVVDTVKDLEWVVIAWEGMVKMKRFLSKYEAIEWADDLKASEARA